MHLHDFANKVISGGEVMEVQVSEKKPNQERVRRRMETHRNEEPGYKHNYIYSTNY